MLGLVPAKLIPFFVAACQLWLELIVCWCIVYVKFVLIVYLFVLSLSCVLGLHVFVDANVLIYMFLYLPLYVSCRNSHKLKLASLFFSLIIGSHREFDGYVVQFRGGAQQGGIGKESGVLLLDQRRQEVSASDHERELNICSCGFMPPIVEGSLVAITGIMNATSSCLRNPVV